uniref:Uncharacterized protein n=1 Tax=Rhizophora mucronata TaxID=61149 RepID=A0A2P2IHV6_RHIMU
MCQFVFGFSRPHKFFFIMVDPI